MHEYETKIDLIAWGCETDAIVQYEPDENDILISSVVIRRCVKERGDLVYCPDGSHYLVRVPEYVEAEIFPVLSGKQIATLAQEIIAARAEADWSCVMNEPMTIRFNFPPQFPGVRL